MIPLEQVRRRFCPEERKAKPGKEDGVGGEGGINSGGIDSDSHPGVLRHSHSNIDQEVGFDCVTRYSMRSSVYCFPLRGALLSTHHTTDQNSSRQPLCYCAVSQRNEKGLCGQLIAVVMLV
ncbi:hypothetical protein JZ751_010866 [Albula glossodonta]|uniref:Uncharacterized protein n=1 Tax=Albula glossodonta TaxID=121402 RepID=A0A8T2P6B1_9TELE|nr:hypothetical protein JZ751_010866 [Albula glossodonta]